MRINNNNDSTSKKPFMGYSKNPMSYNRINVPIDHFRNSYKKNDRYVETFVSHRERFLYETGIRIGNWFEIEKEFVLDNEKKISYSGRELSVPKYQDDIFKRKDEIIKIPSLRLGSFYFIMETKSTEEIYPIARIDKKLLKYRNYTEEELEEEDIKLSSHPIRGIFLIIEENNFNNIVGKVKRYFLTTCAMKKDIPTHYCNTLKGANEKIIITEFFNLINKEVDILIGNGLFREYCDTSLHYPLTRLLENGIEIVNLGKIRSKTKIINIKDSIELIPTIDLENYVKSDRKYGVKSLEYTYYMETNEKLMKLSYKSITQSIKHLDIELIKYGFDHAIAPIMIVITKDLVQRALIGASLSCTRIDDMWKENIFNHLVLSMIMAEIAHTEYVMDETYELKIFKEKEYPKGTSYGGGAISANIKKKIADNVYDFDYKSYYPSIVIQNDLDFTNLITQEQFNELKPSAYKKVLIKNEVIKSKLSEVNITKNTYVYYIQNTGKTIYPNILKRLYDRRVKIKNEIANSKLDSYKKSILSIMEIQLKKLMNCFYGVTGNSNSILSNKPLAASITSIGREILTNTISHIEKHLLINNNNVTYVNHIDNIDEKSSRINVIHYHTDGLSLIIEPEIGSSIKIARDICSYINKWNNMQHIILEFEEIRKRKIFHNRKDRSAIDFKDNIKRNGTWGMQSGRAKLLKDYYNQIEELLLKNKCNADHIIGILKNIYDKLNSIQYISDLTYHKKYTSEKNLYNDKSKRDAMKALENNIKEFDYPLKGRNHSIEYVRIIEEPKFISPQYIQGNIDKEKYFNELWKEIYDLLWDRIPIEDMKKIYDDKKELTFSTEKIMKINDIEDLMKPLKSLCIKCEDNPCNTFTHNREKELFSHKNCNNKYCDVWKNLNFLKK